MFVGVLWPFMIIDGNSEPNDCPSRETRGITQKITRKNRGKTEGNRRIGEKGRKERIQIMY